MLIRISFFYCPSPGVPPRPNNEYGVFIEGAFEIAFGGRAAPKADEETRVLAKAFEFMNKTLYGSEVGRLSNLLMMSFS
jgi:hypothetical protein